MENVYNGKLMDLLVAKYINLSIDKGRWTKVL